MGAWCDVTKGGVSGIDVKNVFYVFYFKIKNAFFNVFYYWSQRF